MPLAACDGLDIAEVGIPAPERLSRGSVRGTPGVLKAGKVGVLGTLGKDG